MRFFLRLIAYLLLCGSLLPSTGAAAPRAVWADYDGANNPIYLGSLRNGRWSSDLFRPALPFNANAAPCLAIGEGGEEILLWAARGDCEAPRIYFSLLREGEWSPARLVDPGGIGWETTPVVAFDRWGRPWAAWARVVGGSTEVFAAAWEGRGFGRPTILSAPDTSPDEYPSITFGKDGEPIVVWQGWRNGSALTFESRFRDGSWTEEKLLDPTPPPPSSEKVEAAREVTASNYFIGLGDSITYGEDGSDDDGWYGSLLAGMLESALPGDTYHLYNEGYPGAYTGQLLLGGTEWDPTYPGIDGIIDRHPLATRIFLMAGTNDLKGLVPYVDTKYNLGEMIDRARNKGVEPVLATIIPLLKYGEVGFDASSDLSNNYITPLAAEKDCQLSDPFQVYVDYYYLVDSWEPLYDYPGGAGDGIHPVWPAGDQKIADAWFTVFSSATLPIIDSGDYDGDGTSDIALFRAASGFWAVREITRVYFGTSGDIPVSGDYDGDGTTDIALFRGSSGLWAVRGITRIYLGSSSDIPVPGDYDGDGSCQAGIFRPSNGLWSIPGITRTYYGAAGDLPAPGYYDAANPRKKLTAVFRPTSGLWASPGFTRVYYGASGDYPVPGQYNQDKDDWEIGIFRPSNGLWSILDTRRFYFGSSADQPIPADYEGDHFTDFAIFRDSTGLWAVQEVTRVYFGTSGDVAVSGRVPKPPATPVPTPQPTAISPTPTPAPTAMPPTPTPAPTATPAPTP